MKSKEIKEKLNEGYMQVNVLYEIVGNPKDHVAKALDIVIQKIKQHKNIIVISEEKGEPEDAGEGLWGSYCEAEMLVKDLRTLSWMAFNFIPASIEIKEPGKLVLKDKEVTDFMNDLLAQLHETNRKTIQTNSVNTAMLKNINALMRNLVLVSLKQSDKTAAELAREVGIKEDEIKPLMDAMLKEKTIEQKGSKYKRVLK
ncbi:MAG: hypothetical protein ACP5N3_00635 [Candidatus Nanoarchaeia archaeon]